MIKLELKDSYVSHESEFRITEQPNDIDASRSNQLWKEIKTGAEDKGGQTSFKKHYEDKRFRPIPKTYGDGGFDFYIAEILTIVFGSSGLIITYLTTIKPFVIEWLKNRNGRSVKIKQGEKEIELTGLKDFQEALDFIKELNENNANNR